MAILQRGIVLNFKGKYEVSDSKSLARRKHFTRLAVPRLRAACQQPGSDDLHWILIRGGPSP